MSLSNWPLRAKMAALLLVVAVLPLAIVAYVDLRQAQAQRLNDLQAVLRARGDQIVNELDAFNRGHRVASGRIAAFPDVLAFCAGEQQASDPLYSRALALLSTYPASDPDIRGVGLLDASGKVLLATEAAMVGVDLSHQPHIRAAMAGRPAISDIFIGVEQAGQEPTIAFMTPVASPGGQRRCIVALWVRARALWQTVKASNALVGAGSFAVLFDKTGIRIAHTYSDEIVFHPGGKLDPATVDALVAERRFGDRTRALLEDVRNFPEQFERARAEVPSSEVFRGFAPVNQSWTYGVGRRFASVPWTVFYMVPESTLLAPLAQIQRERLLLTAAVLAAAAALGLMFVTSILRPVRALLTATTELAGGRLGARIAQPRSDELGRLGAGFNAMAERIEAQAKALQQSRDELEQRVQERTAELTQALAQLEQGMAERTRIANTLRERDAGLQRAQALARLAHVVTRLDGSFASWSDTLPEMAGLPLDDMPRSVRGWLMLVHPDDREQVRLRSIEAAQTGTRTDANYRLRHPDGRWRHIHQVNDPMSESQQAEGPLQWFCTFQDVSEQQQAEQELRESELRFRQLAETIEDVFWVSTLDFSQLIYLSPAYERIWGRPREGAYEDVSAWRDSIHPDDIAHMLVDVQRTGDGAVGFQREYRIVRPDGGVRWISNRGFPILDANGLAYRVAGVASDVTERKQQEQSARRLAAIVQSSDDAIIGKTLQGVITSWNPAAERLFGYTEAEALGQSMMMLLPPERADEEPTILARLAHGESVDHFETQRVHKDGRLIDISATISPVRDALGQVVGASKIARDITHEKLAQARQQAQLERLSLLDQITRAVGERQDLQSIYRVVAGSLEESMPADFAAICSREAAGGTLRVAVIGTAGRTFADTMALAEGIDISIDADGLSRCLDGELVHEPDTAQMHFPFPQRLAAAGLRSLVLAPLHSDPGVFGVLVVARRRPHGFSSAECEFLRQLSAHVALAAQQARLYEALQQAYDELRQTQQAVMQQERLRALGQMASGIAHDINNAISPILLYTETLLEREANLSERARNYLSTISRSIDDVAATVARLREFYRQREPQLALLPVQLAPLVQQVIEMTRARWSDMPQERGAVVELQTELAAGLPEVLGIESEIREALVNLVFNAIDAMPDGGKLTLRSGQAGDAPPGGATEAEAGCVYIEVQDTGTGMDEDTRRRCLEPFYTTKGERGTGLGLAMVYGIAQRHGADIDIDSAPGQGTRVRLAFPIPQQSAQASWPPLDAIAPMRALRLLLVDDDPIVLRSLADALQADGHATLGIDGGQAGIAAFVGAQGSARGFDAVITDLGMPHVDGRQVARAVKQASPHTPVILLTGWGQRLIADEEVPDNVDRVLSKPPKMREIRRALAELSSSGTQEKTS